MKNTRPPAEQIRSLHLTRSKKVIYASIPTIAILIAGGLFEIILRRTETRVDSRRWSQAQQLTIELGLGDAGKVFEPDPTRFWRLKRNLSLPDHKSNPWGGFITNSLGFRNSEFSLAREDGSSRILALGDSTTFGQGVSLPSSWPSRLEKLFSKAGRPVQVVNAGVPGYSSHQGLEVLRGEFLNLQPDLVIINFGNNDAVSWGNHTDRSLTQVASIRNWLHASAIFRVLESSIQRNERSKPDSQWSHRVSHSYNEEATGRDGWIPRVPLEEYEENIDAMIALCRQKNTKTMLLIWPFRMKVLGGRNPRAHYQARTQEIARQHGIPVVDLNEAFIKSNLGEKLFIDSIHGTDLAQEIASREIFFALQTAMPIRRQK